MLSSEVYMSYPSYLVHFNPNHDKLGRFTFSKDGSVSEKKSPDLYRTSELDSKYKAYKDAKVSEFYERIMKLPWVESDDNNTEEIWGKDVVKIADIGLEGLGWLNPGDIDDNSERSWFLFEDQTIGMPEIAYLASQGKSVKEIVDMINSVNDCEHQNNEFLEQYREEFHKNRKVYDDAEKNLPYPDAYYCGFTEYGRTDEKDEFINGCVEVAKKMEHSDSSDYLAHFNPNHDPKTGQFTYALGGGPSSKGTYNGQSKKEFVKGMTEQYKSGGYGSMKSKALARSAAKAYDQNRKQYNVQFRKNQRAASKLESAKAIGDQKKIDKYNKQLKESFRDATVAKEMFKESYALGKDWYDRTVAQYLGGIPAQIAVANKEGGYIDIYNRTKSNVERWMNASPEFHEFMYNTELESITDIR